MRGILRPSAVLRAAGPVIVARVQRTTTTATLLVTVAVSALTGCVTVQQPPGPRPTAAPPHPRGDTEPQIVQAPAREALEMIGPSRRPKPKTPQRHRPSPPPKASAPTAREPAPAPSRHPRPPTTHPATEPHRQPHVDIPDLTNGTGLCALGRQYGGWRADSPEAAICEQTYGR